MQGFSCCVVWLQAVVKIVRIVMGAIQDRHGPTVPGKTVPNKPARLQAADRQVRLWKARQEDVVAKDGRVYDSDRVMFLRACLGQLQRATSEGVPVDGYFLWSAQDNFEWIDGFGNRFGLIYVDFDTLARIPKLSAEWFREAARQNAVV